jgi:hypothetical protein
MKCIIVLRVVLFFGVAGSLFLEATGALSLEVAPFSVETTVSDSSVGVSRSEESPAAARQSVGKATNKADLPTAGPSDQNGVVSIAEIVSVLDQSFSEQPSDVEWSGHAEERVRVLFQPLTSNNTTLISVRCRTTLCRVDFLHAGATEFHNFLGTLKTGGLMGGWKGELIGGRVGTNLAGPVRSVFFLAKEGTNLPLGSSG